MRWSPRSFPVEIRWELDPTRLAQISDGELDDAGSEGSIAGNHAYQDLRGFTWQDVEATLSLERSIIDRLIDAPELEAAIAEFEDARARSIDEQAALWDLDIGVASAVLALSAMGATPVSSCNAAAFGGHHVAAFPYVAFYLPTNRIDEVYLYASLSNVGLINDSSGVAQIFGADEKGLVRFAEVALAYHHERRPA